MRTRWLYSPGSSDKAGGSLFQKMWMAAVIVALMTAFLPISGVLAAPAGDPANGGTLEEQWSNKISMVHAENLFYAQVKLFPVDYKNSKDMARPYDLLDKYGSALKKANDIITKHDGFDETGDVIQEELATQSVEDLGECLRTMRSAVEKLEEEGYPFHRIK